MYNNDLKKNTGTQGFSKFKVVSIKKNGSSFKNKSIPQQVKAGDFYSPLDNLVNALIKRLFDFMLSSLLILFLLSWLIPLFALLIKLDSNGPVFFLQRRYKKNKQLFTCIKFRTMIVNDKADIQIAALNDTRITSIGRFLRRYHFDELPQLFNVWSGDMSIVGPRPYMTIENNNFEEMFGCYLLRYKVKPGITGLAQSQGLCGPIINVDKLKERVELDLQYINRWSVGADLLIIYRTLRSICSFKRIKCN